MSEDLLAASLLSETAATPSLADRLRGAIWGQLVGDAFCLGTHWIYDLDELAEQFPNGVQGFEAPMPGHYHAGKQPGDQTHYGDGALVMLESVAGLGRFDEKDFGVRFVRFFSSADYRGYLDHATQGTMENAVKFAEEHPGQPFDYQHGADDDQLATASRLAPAAVAHYKAGRAELLAHTEAATRVTQNNATAVAYMKANVLILAALFEGQTPRAALQHASTDAASGAARQKIQDALAARFDSVTEAALAFGQSCPLPGSFPVSAFCLLKHADSFRDAMLANARAGGDNAGRGALIGGWLGAALGVEAIPAQWRNLLAAHERIKALVDKLLTRLLG